MTHRQKLLGRSLSALGIVTGTLFALLLTTYAVLQTQPGRNTVARFVAGQLSQGEASVAFGALEGNLLGEFMLRDIRVADLKGTWLTIDNATVAWRPLELLRGRLWVTLVVLSQTDVARRPVEKSDTRNVAFEVPRPPVHIMLEKFALDHVVLAEPVLGEAMTLGVKGTSAADLSGVMHTEITLTRLDRYDDNARLKATFDAGTKQLSVEANVDSPRGGLIPRLLALPDLAGVSLAISGSGPLHGWQAEYQLSADQLAQIQGNASLRVSKQTRVELRGQLSAEQNAPDALATLARPSLSFDADLELTQNKQLHVHRAVFTNTLGKVSLQGRLARETVDMVVTLDVEKANSERLAELTQPLSVEHAGLTAHVTGSLAQPQADLDVTLEGLLAPDGSRVDRLTGSLSVALTEPLPNGSMQPRVVGHGVLEGIRTANPDLQPLVNEPVAWTTRGTTQPERQLLILEEFTAKTRVWQIAAEGRVALAGNDIVDMDADLWLADLSNLEALVQRPLAGNARLSFNVQSAAGDPSATATVTAEIHDLATGDATLDQALGPRVALSAELQRDTQGTLTANSVTLTTTTATLTGTAQLPADFSTIDANYTATLSRLDTMSPWLGINVSGGGTADGVLSGATLNPDVMGAVSLAQVEVDDVRIGGISVDFALQELRRPRGTVKLVLADSPHDPASLRTRLELTEDLTLRLRDVEAKATGTTVTGELSVQLESGLTDGRLTGRAEDLSAWSVIAGRRLSGKTAFETTLSSQADKQNLELALDGDDITIHLDAEQILDIQKLTLSASLSDVLGTARGPVSFSVEQTRVGALLVETLTAAAEAEGFGTKALTLQANGVWNEPFTASLSGAVSFATPGAYDIELSRLEASVFEQQIVLEQSLRLSVAPRQLVLQDLSLTVAGGQVDASARVQQESVDVALKLEALPLTLLTLAFPGASIDGKVSGAATLTGPRTNPTGTLDVELTGLRQTETLITDAPELSGRVAGEWHDRRLRLDGDLQGLADTKLTWRAQMPLRMQPETLGLHVPLDETIAGEARWNGAVAPLWRLLSHSENSLTGTGELSLTLGGTFGEPRVDGRVALEDGRYENIAAGTLLEQITVVAKGNNDRLVLTQATAGDGVGGTIEAQGEVILDVTKHFPVDMRLELNNAMLIQRDDLTATTSGELAFRGNMQDAELAGTIVTQRVDAQLGTNLPPQVVELQVVEVNHPAGSTPATQKTQANGPEFVNLMLDIDLPGRVFVRGLGIDSEWRGNLRVRGTADKPIVKGELRPVRGRYSFAGKVFELRDGSVRFTGSRPIDPMLNLPAEFRTSSVTAIISVTGRASNPVVELSSRPPMPQSEIASRVIFGAEQSNLSPLQTIQLADAVAALTGDGVGILEHARRSVGVDVLKLGNANNDDGDPTVAVGKYITDRVYVEIEQGMTPGSTGGTVEVEVVPEISVFSGRTQDGNNKLGIRWRRDY